MSKSTLNLIKENIHNYNLDNHSIEIILNIFEMIHDLNQISEIMHDSSEISYDYLEKLINCIVNFKVEISCILIIKNGEDTINNFIENVISKFDELIIIDTGSKDKTVELIKKNSNEKIKLFTYTWKDSFADARNFGISKVTKEWIFFIDIDEIMDEKTNYLSLHHLFSFLNITSFENVYYTPMIIEERSEQVYHDIPRIFHKKSNLSYYGNVHEELRSSNNGNITAINLNIVLYHTGYSRDHIAFIEKMKRNIFLIDKTIISEPNNTRWKYFKYRDGYQIYNKSFIKNEIIENLKIDKNAPFSIKNVVIDNYTIQSLLLLCKVCIAIDDQITLNATLSMLNILFPNSSDTMFYHTLNNMINLKKQFFTLLSEILVYRKNNMAPQYNMMSTQGYHIDLLIAILLFENMDYIKAKKYFDFVEDKFTDLDIIQLISKYQKLF